MLPGSKVRAAAIGHDVRPYIETVAEFTTNPMGNFHLLMRMLEAAALTGCDYVKMQKKDVEHFYSPEQLSRHYPSPYGTTYRDYRSIFEFTRDEFDRFDRRCKQLGQKWFSTAQDIPSLEFLLPYDLGLYKVASSRCKDLAFLRDFASIIPRRAGVVLSVAGADLGEIEQALACFPNHAILLNHCVAVYPCPPDRLKLGNIPVLKEAFGSSRIRIGYSGHERGLAGSYAAVAMGADCVERHFCISRNSPVHHIDCSLVPAEFSEMVSRLKSGGDLLALYGPTIPEAAFESHFGMSEREKSFLVDQTYHAAQDLALSA